MYVQISIYDMYRFALVLVACSTLKKCVCVCPSAHVHVCMYAVFLCIKLQSMKCVLPVVEHRSCSILVNTYCMYANYCENRPVSDGRVADVVHEGTRARSPSSIASSSSTDGELQQQLKLNNI